MRRQDGTFEKTQEITFSMCDFTERIKPSALLVIAADIAGDDYSDRGLPHDALLKEGVVFLVSRVRFSIKRRIRAEESIKLISYERRVTGPFCIRDYIVEDDRGEIIIAGRSAWIICDPVSRRILRPASFPHPIQNHEDIILDVGEPEKLKLPQDMEKVCERKVVYSDLDGNGHVNNSVYGDMASDVLPMELFNGEIKEFAINFVKEARMGDPITIFRGKDGDREFIAGFLGDSLCFECAFTFKGQR